MCYEHWAQIAALKSFFFFFPSYRHQLVHSHQNFIVPRWILCVGGWGQDLVFLFQSCCCAVKDQTFLLLLFSDFTFILHRLKKQIKRLLTKLTHFFIQMVCWSIEYSHCCTILSTWIGVGGWQLYHQPNCWHLAWLRQRVEFLVQMLYNTIITSTLFGLAGPCYQFKLLACSL